MAETDRPISAKYPTRLLRAPLSAHNQQGRVGGIDLAGGGALPAPESGGVFVLLFGRSVQRARRTAAVAALTVAVLAILVPASSASAGAPMHFVFPGCAPTLQECIDHADPTSTITVVQQVIHETVVITKSLTLQGGDGLRPKVDEIDVVTQDDLTLVTRVRQLEVLDSLSVDLFRGHDHQVSLVDLKVDNMEQATGIDIETAVPAAFDVERSHVRSTGVELSGISVYAISPAGRVSARLVANRVGGSGSTNGYSGIAFDVGGGGTFVGDVMNNVVWNVAQCTCGASAGISLVARKTLQARLNIVGNTIAAIHSGDVAIEGEQDAGGHLDVNIFNNILGRTNHSGIAAEATGAGTLSYHSGFNDHFQTARHDSIHGADPGPGNLSVNPMFTDAAHGDFRLRNGSPAIDRGVVCSRGGVADPDVAGNHRLFGSTVDLGAFEHGAGVPTGIVLSGSSGPDSLTGTKGDDILCGLGGGDNMAGKAGNDYLSGGLGEDFVFAGPGSDRVFGGPGDDLLCARDGVSGNDRIDGGTGHDVVQRDAGDPAKNVEHKSDCAA